LYAWTLMLAGLALALRFVPYSKHGILQPGWSALLAAYALIVALASVYLVYVLEIVKFRGRAASQLKRRGVDPQPLVDEPGAVAQRRAGGVRRS
ncbi:MAG TPA: hypothetical protein VIJ33_05930, partial [Solirubrobacteraceae bacterium]